MELLSCHRHKRTACVIILTSTIKKFKYSVQQKVPCLWKSFWLPARLGRSMSACLWGQLTWALGLLVLWLWTPWETPWLLLLVVCQLLLFEALALRSSVCQAGFGCFSKWRETYWTCPRVSYYTTRILHNTILYFTILHHTILYYILVLCPHEAYIFGGRRQLKDDT